MNNFLKTYNEKRKELGLRTSVVIADKSLILTISDDNSNIVAVKNIKNNNAEMAYTAAFEDAVRNYFQLEEEHIEVSPIVAEMMPAEDEIMQMMQREENVPATNNLPTEEIVGQVSSNFGECVWSSATAIEMSPSTREDVNIAINCMESTPVFMESVAQEVMNCATSALTYTESYAEPVVQEIPITPTSFVQGANPDNMMPNIPMEPVVYEDMSVYNEPVISSTEYVATTTNPVQESLNELKPTYCDESQIGVGNPAKTLITFGLGTGRTIEECSDTEIMWYLNNIQTTSKFANLLTDMREYAKLRGWIS